MSPKPSPHLVAPPPPPPPPLPMMDGPKSPPKHMGNGDIMNHNGLMGTPSKLIAPKKKLLPVANDDRSDLMKSIRDGEFFFTILYNFVRSCLCGAMVAFNSL